MLRTLLLFARALLRTLRSRLRHGPAHPGWSFGFEATVAFLLIDHLELASWPAAERRRSLDARPYPVNHQRKLKVRDATLAGRPVRWFEPPNAPAEQLLLFLHGGSYGYCSARGSHAEAIAHLALESGLRTVGLDYRLAPEHPYPAALEDALAAIEALRAEGIPLEGLRLAGDSAGGNLVLTTLLALRERGLPQPAGALLLSPWLDLAARSPSASSPDRGVDYGDRSVLLAQARDFAGGIPLEDPRISPIDAPLSGLAPLLMVSGGIERLRDECAAFAARAAKEGHPLTWEVAAGMPHNPTVLADLHPEGLRVTKAAGRWLAQPR